MKKIILPLLAGSIFFASCMKEEFTPRIDPASVCELQTANPGGKSYPKDSVAAYSCTDKHCGLLALSTKNYWIYEDSVFLDGNFQQVRFDTLRYSKTMMSPDGLTWWESNISIGIPVKLYANDSSLFKLEERLFMPGVMDAKKDFSLFEGDSIRYLTSFLDMAATGRSLKISSPVTTPAGSYSNCLYFEKNARNVRKDQVFYKPGIGVLKYIREEAPMGERVIKLQQISTLVAYHLE